MQSCLNIEGKLKSFNGDILQRKGVGKSRCVSKTQNNLKGDVLKLH